MKKIKMIFLIAFASLAISACGQKNNVSSKENNVLTGSEVLEMKRKETDVRIKDIKNTSNMNISQRKVIYYVANDGDDSNNGLTEETPWKTLDKVNNADLKKGYYVCFKRGDTWRGQLKCKEGVTYSAYGKGEKPNLYGSPFNAGSPDFWTETSTPGVWKLIASFEDDLGCLILNDDNTFAKKVMLAERNSKYYNMTEYRYENFEKDFEGCEPWNGLSSLKDLEFYHDNILPGHTNNVYFKCEVNPGAKYKSIELNTYKSVVSVQANSVKIDNLCIKYSGSLGISATDMVNEGGIKNLKVTNCVLGCIGGSINKSNFNLVEPVRYGNAIQVWAACDGFTVTNNYIYQCYDTAVSPQYTFTGTDQRDFSETNILINKNVFEKYNYGVEYFLRPTPVGNPSVYENFYIEENLFWYAGYGLCEQRPNHGVSCHILSWYGPRVSRCVDPVIIQDNFFALAREWILFLNWGAIGTEQVHTSHPELYNNTFLDYYSENKPVDTSVLGLKGTEIGGESKLSIITYWQEGNDRWKHFWEMALFYNESFELYLNSEHLDETGESYLLGSGNKCYYLR